MKTVRLADLLKTWECQQCVYAYKTTGPNHKLTCGWGGEDKDGDMHCRNVLGCGNWPDFYNDETFNQIRIPR